MYLCSLFSLYNLLPSSYGKAFVYRKALEVAAAGKAADCVVPSFKNIDAFVGDWGIGKLEQRDLFLAVARILKDQKGCDTYPQVHCFYQSCGRISH
jgi:translation initiation factor 3 subunit M